MNRLAELMDDWVNSPAVNVTRGTVPAGSVLRAKALMKEAAKRILELERRVKYLENINGEPRSNGTRTSREAAQELRDTVSGIRREVLRLLVAGDRTCDEVQAILGLSSSTGSARFNELKRLGWITETGDYRLTRGGRKAAVHKITVDGRQRWNRHRTEVRDMDTTSQGERHGKN